MLRWRNASEMLEIFDVPEAAKIYYQLLPPAHGRRLIEEEVTHSAAEDHQLELELKLQLALSLASLPHKDCWGQLAELVGRQEYNPTDPHGAEQWLRLVHLMYHRA